MSTRKKEDIPSETAAVVPAVAPAVAPAGLPVPDTIAPYRRLAIDSSRVSRATLYVGDPVNAGTNFVAMIYTRLEKEYLESAPPRPDCGTCAVVAKKDRREWEPGHLLSYSLQALTDFLATDHLPQELCKTLDNKSLTFTSRLNTLWANIDFDWGMFRKVRNGHRGRASLCEEQLRLRGVFSVLREALKELWVRERERERGRG